MVQVKLYLIYRWIETEKLAMAIALSGLLVEAVQLLWVAKAQEAVHTAVRLERPQVEV